MLLTRWHVGLPLARSRDGTIHPPHHPPSVHDPSKDVYLHVRLPAQTSITHLTISKKRESIGSKTPIWDEDYIHLYPDPLR